MPKFDVKVTVHFEDVEAADESALQELVDNAMGDGAVLFTHPTTGEEVTADHDVTEKE